MKKTCLAGLLLAMSSMAAAGEVEHGFYIGGAIGQSSLELEDADSTVDFNGDDTAYKLIAGYRIIDWVAVEASYSNFGKPNDEIFGIETEGDFSALAIEAVGLLPLGSFDLFAKGGIAAWEGTLRAEDIDVSVSEDNVDIKFGFGAQYRIGGLALRAEYEAVLLGFDDDGDDEADGDDWVDMVSLGLTYTF
ncbi:hypothetical protein HNQ60_005206 [Povalibacter uvarum]|uniref:Outer membrane protein beta-barrel domain-containing protein n=1 Tax=Povalibacter uvarum TaxID=732238 RepID=A0A841HUG2_9GAMM|nr:porin family protein [Povalibacter uvarum]MBB6096284.1 hypothetical protein [Povalibacter uvarum]